MADTTTPQRGELHALTRLAFGELGSATGGIGQIHEAIAGRVFRGVERGVGRSGRVVALAHETIAGGVYGALRGATTLAGRAAEQALPAGRAISSTPRGAAALGALSGLIGDTLEREGSPLAQPMAVRVHGEIVPPEPAAVAEAFPAATPRVAIFLHGLMETELAWRFGGQETYGDRLARELGVTPVYVRYNTGRHISENGR